MSRAMKRISSSLKGGLLGCLAMLLSSFPLLSDTVLTNELPHLLVPLLQVVTTRLVLLNKLLDTVHMVKDKYILMKGIISSRLTENRAEVLAVTGDSITAVMWDRNV